MSDSFIELGRTFHLSVASGAKSDDVDLTQPSGRRGQMSWTDLLGNPRVVILSGGGSGKTMEIRHRAELLHSEGKQAFFLRIEHVRDDFAGAFDRAAGRYEQFLEWVKSGDAGWVFLDSVDEARLKSPKEFEQAIHKLGRVLEPVLQRAHIVITGREAAWRARTDRELIRTHLPYESSSPRAPNSEANEVAVAKGEEFAFEYSDVGSDTDGPGELNDTLDDLSRRRNVDSAKTEPNAVLIVGFDSLDMAQIETFVRAKGVTDVAGFMRAVERREAQSEIARPLDLEGLVDYWNTNGKIGSQFELTEATINRRLSEVDPDRAEATALTREEMRHAAGALAVANVLMQTPEIRLRDALPDLSGVEPRDLLDWPEKDIRILLLRPLFAASQFGSVRLYVQKAREFLTAEWLHRRLVDHASRTRIEGLFFRIQYGIEVVVPGMRGILPWLALLDAEVLARVLRVAPEIMFEGGDPSRLPLEMRRQLLSKACRQLAGSPGRSSLTDFLAVQRFAATDLGGHIKSLLATYHADDEVVYFLMRMVWQGEITSVLDEARQIACSATESSVRQIAIQAVGVLGADSDRAAVRAVLVSGPAAPEREWVTEAIETLPRDSEGVSWLLQACIRADPESRYSMDPLPNSIEAYVKDLSLELLPPLVAGLEAMLALHTRSDDDDGARGQFSWLMGSAIAALDRLVQANDPAAFEAPAMNLLLQIPAAVRLSENSDREGSARLADHVVAWIPLNRALFWADVEATRERRLKKSGKPLVDFFGVGIFGHYWRLTDDDFDHIEKAITARPLMDDRLVALSVAHVLYLEHGRLPSRRKKLRRRAKGVQELEAALNLLLAPKSDQVKKWARQEAKRKQRSERERARRDANREEWRIYLQENVDSLRTPFPDGGVRGNQKYLLERMREFDKHSSRWAAGKWRSLIPEFGLDVAKAFRDGAVAFWRTNTPKLISNGAERNTTLLTTIYGLVGLLFESRETRDWASQVTAEHAELATRYAVCELNGFPPWLPQLFAFHREPVAEVVLGEIEYELSTALAIDSPSHHVLSDVSSVGSWLWNRLAPELLIHLETPPPSAAHLRQALSILSGSEVEGRDIAALASRHALTSVDELATVWFAAWIGVDPEPALHSLAAHLAALPDRPRQVEFAMLCLVALTGGRRGRSVARDGHRRVPHLTTLFLLMHQYIVEDEDVDRAGKGVYSPSLRDDAQDARGALLARLRDTPGEEAYYALLRIAAEHPSKQGRDWAARLAHARAVTDSEGPGWLGSQVRDFQQTLERTPRNHRELHDLAVDRLIDLKHSLEHGETSIAEVLLTPKETAIRNVVANWCRERGLARYMIAQEEEFADKKRTDIRFLGMAFDNPVPAELKLANLWSGAVLAERLENQLCNDYLRDQRSSRGIFLLINQGGRSHWDLPDGSRVTSVEELTDALQAHWRNVARDFRHVHAVQVIGIDLTMRAKPMGRSDKANVLKMATRKAAKPSGNKAAKNATAKPVKQVVTKPA